MTRLLPVGLRSFAAFAAFSVLVLLLLPLARAAAQERPVGPEPLPEPRTFGEPVSASDAQAIGTLLRDFRRAWGSGDVEGALAAYAEDAEWTNAFGRVCRGHDELRTQFTSLFQRFEADSDDDGESTAGGSEPETEETRPAVRGEQISMRYLGDDAAVVHAYTESSWGVNRDDGSDVRRVHITYVLQKRAGRWQIVHQMIMDARL